LLLLLLLLLLLFDCDNGLCQTGPYQDLCPQCDDLEYGGGISAIQCMCFDSQKMLQSTTTISDSQTCSTISADSTGTLICNKSSKSNEGKHNKGRRELVYVKSNDATAAPTPQFLRTESPSVGPGDFHVDFVFNCAAGTCPDGPYQTFCPRCTVNTDSTTPGNDPENSISCECFNRNGQMLLRTATMWGFDKCPSIQTSLGGSLICVGAGKNSGIRTYGGRRLEESQ